MDYGQEDQNSVIYFGIEKGKSLPFSKRLLRYWECVFVCCCTIVVCYVCLIVFLGVCIGISFIHKTKYNLKFWNENVEKFESTYQYDFPISNVSFNYYSEFESITSRLILDRQPDPTPLDMTQGLNEKDVETYDPVKYLNDTVLFIHRNTKFKNRQSSLVIKNGMNRHHDSVNVILMEESSFNVKEKDGKTEKEVCEDYTEAKYSDDTKTCHQKWILESICITIDPEDGKQGVMIPMEMNTVNKNPGCFRGVVNHQPSTDVPNYESDRPSGTEEYIVGSYKILPFSTTEIHEDVLIKITIRHFQDPFLKLYEGTKGTLILPKKVDYFMVPVGIILSSLTICLFSCPSICCVLVIIYVLIIRCLRLEIKKIEDTPMIRMGRKGKGINESGFYESTTSNNKEETLSIGDSEYDEKNSDFSSEESNDEALDGKEIIQVPFDKGGVFTNLGKRFDINNSDGIIGYGYSNL